MPKGVYKRKPPKPMTRAQKDRRNAQARKRRKLAKKKKAIEAVLEQENQAVETTDVPKDWMPLFEWHGKWHYGKQKEYVNALRDCWEVQFLGGNGTGKTHILYWNLICYALGIHPFQFAPPPLKIKVLITDFEHGYGKIFSETCLDTQYMPDGTEIKRMLPDSTVGRYPTRDDRTLKFKKMFGGSEILFQTSEQKKKLHSGTNFDILACDEEPVYQVYDESKRGLRTAKGGGKILHAMTPPFDEEDKNKGPSWTKFKLLDVFEKGEDPDIYVVRAAMMDNPGITPEFIKKFSKGKTEDQVKIQLYGDYPVWGKMIFPAFEDRIWNARERSGNLLPYDFDVPWNDPDCRFEMAVDWHGSKPCAVIWSFEYLSGANKGDVVVFDELSPKDGKGLTISETCVAIREIEGYASRQIVRWGDPKMRDKNNALISGFNPWEAFRHEGVRLKEAWNREPYTGYSVINDFLRGKTKRNLDHPRLFIRENCKTLIYNMKNHYNKPNGDGTASPDAKFSDYCVNLKYIMQEKARKVKKGMLKRRSWPLTSNGKRPFQNEHVDISHFVTNYR